MSIISAPPPASATDYHRYVILFYFLLWIMWKEMKLCLLFYCVACTWEVCCVRKKQIQFLFLGIFKGIIEFCGNISQRINTSSSIFKPNKLTTTGLKNNSSQRITLFLVYYWFLTCCLANVPARLALEKADGLMVGIKPKRTRWATSISSVAQADGPGQIEEKESEIGL